MTYAHGGIRRGVAGPGRIRSVESGRHVDLTVYERRCWGQHYDQQ